MFAVTLLFGASGCNSFKDKPPIVPPVQDAGSLIPADFLTGPYADVQVMAAPVGDAPDAFSIVFAESALEIGETAAALITLCGSSYLAAERGYRSLSIAEGGTRFAGLMFMKIQLLNGAEAGDTGYSISHPAVRGWCSAIVDPKYAW